MTDKNMLILSKGLSMPFEINTDFKRMIKKAVIFEYHTYVSHSSTFLDNKIFNFIEILLILSILLTFN